MEGRLTDVQTWNTSPASLGLTPPFNNRDLLYRGPAFRLPPEIGSTLGHWFALETDGTRPLWVHLVKPYGALRLVPWEQLLVEAVHAPILMLPDFIFPPPLEAKDSLDVAVCGSAPLGHEEHSIVRALAQSVGAIARAAPRRLRINVFTDRDIAGRLPGEPAWPTATSEVEIIVHDAAGAEKYAYEDQSSRLLDKTGALRSPWLLWMRDALKTRPVDVVHFVCHGYLARDRGALLFAQSPAERTERFLAGPVSAPELQTFLTQIGAWSTVLTGVADNYSDPGLRALADDIAQSRPGPLMIVWGGIDPNSPPRQRVIDSSICRSPSCPGQPRLVHLLSAISSPRRRPARAPEGARDRHTSRRRPSVATWCRPGSPTAHAKRLPWTRYLPAATRWSPGWPPRSGSQNKSSSATSRSRVTS